MFISNFKNLLLFSGIVGDWKNQFTTAQSEILEEKFEEVMKDADITFSYEPTS